MAYKKVIIAVDCATEEEQQMVQSVAKELSEAFRLKASDLLQLYPILKQHKHLLYTAVQILSKEGKKGFFKLIPLLMKQL